ncbi:MAG: hypothetical protein ACI4RD_08470 [Kiritimatiellia bacterium]
MREVFVLEMRALVRSHALALLCAANVAWMLLLPYFLRGDGTAEGAQELYVRFSLGGAFVLTVVCLLASATGALARERAQKRLMLTLVRPVSAFAIVVGKALALVTAGGLVLGFACLVLAFRTDLTRPCDLALSPVLPSAREEAKLMYADYMQDPQTPEAVRQAPRAAVLRLLERRAVDHFQSVRTNETASWRFAVPAGTDAGTALGVRIRFTNRYEMRQDLFGTFRIGDCCGTVSNITQSVVSVPLSRGRPGRMLTFVNRGQGTLMLRPRRDIHLLVRADAFVGNLARAYVEMVAILALVVAAGLFLSAGLGRPVALFVAFVTLVLGEMSPSVVEQYPDELETNVADRIGLVITRLVSEATRPLSAAAPLEALSRDECIPPSDVGRLVLADAVLLPLLLSCGSALILRRKAE